MLFALTIHSEFRNAYFTGNLDFDICNPFSEGMAFLTVNIWKQYNDIRGKSQNAFSPCEKSGLTY